MTYARGRPPKLTDELIDQIVALVRAGNYPAVAARAAGVPPRTFHRWMAMGREGKARYAPLLERIEEAEDLAEAALVASLRAHATRDAKLALAFLERRFAKRWSRRDAGGALPDTDSEPIQLTEEDRARLRRLAERADERRRAQREGTEPLFETPAPGE